MKEIAIKDVAHYVEKHICEFHKSRIASLKLTKLNNLLLKKNPYLVKNRHDVTTSCLFLSTLRIHPCGHGWILKFEDKT